MKNIRRYVERYLCQKIENRTKVLVEKLMENKVLKKAWTHLMVDFITKLLLIAKKNVILVVCNQLSKIVYLVAITEETLVEGLIRLFRDNIQKLHSLLESIISNKGLQFVVKLMKELNRILGIETRLSTAFYPQIDRQMNQELEQYLRFFTEYRQSDQLKQLVSAEFVVNNKVYSATKVLLFIANYERKLRMEQILGGKKK